MALDKCPYMTARCPHYQSGCNDPASKDCHHIKRTTAGMVTAVTVLRALNVGELSPAMQQYLQQTEAFLREMKISS